MSHQDSFALNETKNEDEPDASKKTENTVNESDKSPTMKASKRSRTNSLPYKPGMYVEAKDFAEVWYSAKVVEVDYDGREVLVHFLNWSSRYDEWISMESNRLREAPPPDTKAASTSNSGNENGKEPLKVGDKVLAPWTGGGKKYPAQITKILSDDNLEVVFLDGLESTVKACKVARLPKDQADKLVIPDPNLPESESQAKEPEVLSKQGRRLAKKKFSIADLTASRKRVSDQRGNLNEFVDPTAYISDEEAPAVAKAVSKETSTPKEEKKTRGKKNETSEPVAKKKKISSAKATTSEPMDPASVSEEEAEDSQQETSERSDSPPTVRLEDPSLPSGWSKRACRKLMGSSLGKWDVFILSPDGKKFRKREDLATYLEQENLSHDIESFDFGMSGSGKARNKPQTTEEEGSSFSSTPVSTSSSAARRRFRGKKQKAISKAKASPAPPPTPIVKEEPSTTPLSVVTSATPVALPDPSSPSVVSPTSASPSTERPRGVEKYICPQDGCEKQFRNESLLQMHIKHYHPELRQAFGGGRLPNVYDLAYARTAFDRPLAVERKDQKRPAKESKSKASPVPASASTPQSLQADVVNETSSSSADVPAALNKRSTSTDTPPPAETMLQKMEQFKKPKIELQRIDFALKEAMEEVQASIPPVPQPAQSPLTPYDTLHSMLLGPKISRRRQALLEKRGLWPVGQQDEEEFEKEAIKESREAETAGPGGKVSGDSNKGPGRPKKLVPGTSTDGAVSGNEAGDSNAGIETEEMLRDRGELVHCICGIPEEEGLMVQCELCHGWQHGFCFGMEHVSDVPERYLCYVCKMPYKERRSQHFVPYLSWLQEDLPSVRTKEGSQCAARSAEDKRKRTVVFRKANALVSAGLDVKRVLQSLDVKIDIAKKKDHPKLYLWAQSWRKPEHEKISLSDLAATSPMPSITKQDKDKEQREDFSKGGPEQEPNICMPMEAAPDLEQLAAVSEALTVGIKTVRIPEPEKPIDSLECRLNILAHVEQMQDMLNEHLDAIESTVNELDDDGEVSDNESDKAETICRLLSILNKDVGMLREVASL